MTHLVDLFLVNLLFLSILHFFVIVVIPNELNCDIHFFVMLYFLFFKSMDFQKLSVMFDLNLLLQCYEL